MPDTFPVKTEPKPPAPAQGGFWSPFESLRTEIDRLFDDFGPSSWRPLTRSFSGRAANEWVVSPAVDVVEKDDAFEITAEVPGLDEKNIEVKLANGVLTIRGEKSEEKEEKDKSYHVSERHYGSFQRSFQLPEYVDADKVKAAFAKGVLKVTLPKTPNAKRNDRKIEITAS
ncbi:molecular chaperone Hsp20 [Rhizobium sp. AC44/96]|uniref:Hsp20/alpha crystallin family protein n=1 Tax=Rhizobium grahamii TaxID=1120045 RepID=A0A5Q0C6H3_9HYPH|nr:MULTISPECIES: Hsp20/alpha crystallin family protein [Rhizobium]OCJ16433.1 molecular chaperone Hsp20 [Rhizobium sp. AC44/96]QFY61102.1 Hsp20/alpha crystallin family protein [Rhizobium grahamii]QRM49746.1 Hsp20/alpha crystallin family protein [Rhizobium sp. BG6]